jgi:MbtH protein
VASPSADDNREYLVLVNSAGRHSSWPAFVNVPGGWQTADQDDRGSCLRYVDENWRDMWPLNAS